MYCTASEVEWKAVTTDHRYYYDRDHPSIHLLLNPRRPITTATTTTTSSTWIDDDSDDRSNTSLGVYPTCAQVTFNKC
jgi:hypothetical protein